MSVTCLKQVGSRAKKNNWKCCGVKDTKILTDVKCQYTRDTAEKQ